MISPIGESAQVALQATTIGPSPQAMDAARENDKTAEKPAAVVADGGIGKDTVTISAEAKQLSMTPLNSTDESQESSKDKSKEAAAGKK